MSFRSLSFVKMHGLGNDFVLMACEDVPPETHLDKLAAYVCDRHFGVGADGLIIIAPPTDLSRFDVQFIYYNSDGSRAEMCGNGIRCFALNVLDRGLLEKSTFRVETPAGLVVPQVKADRTVTVDMGLPRFRALEIPFSPRGTKVQGDPILAFPLPVLERAVPVTLVNMGNPHCLVFQDDLDVPLDPVLFGPALEKHPAFPEKTNVEFVEVLTERSVKVVVWERGCGFTLACGTGACAVAVGAVLTGKTEPDIEVHLPGGPLRILWDKGESGHVFMTGPAEYVFEGIVRVPESIAGKAEGRETPVPY